MQLNRIVLIGRLVADPEERQGQDFEIARFRIAVNRIRRGRDGQEVADFFNVVCFRHSARFVLQYLRKGNLVAVDGSCQIDQYTDRDNNPQTWVEVVADNVQNLTPRGEGSYGSDGGGGSRYQHEPDDDYRDDDRSGGRGRGRGADDRGGSRGGGRDDRRGGSDDRGPSRRQQFPRDTDDTRDLPPTEGGRAGSGSGNYDNDDDDPFADE
ncbi:MAG TPA: hypothetical protein DCZ72_16060 [Armatimonadetes bacterium]|nr:hypothetical protein [Armatimonadota bacterium]